MMSFCRWIAFLWLPASVVFAQGPVDLTKSAVTVVFAPDYSRMTQRASLHSIETPAARILGAMTGGRLTAADPVEFSAPKGMIGIRTGPESVMAAVMTIGEDGKPQISCSRLPDALERLKSANTAGRSAGKGSAR
jgi:hypothetical protein